MVDTETLQLWLVCILDVLVFPFLTPTLLSFWNEKLDNWLKLWKLDQKRTVNTPTFGFVQYMNLKTRIIGTCLKLFRMLY